MNTMSDRMATGRGNKSGWSLAALALVSFAVLIALGSWQLDRSEWKRALIAERQAMLVQPPVILTGDAVDAKAASFRRVSLTGTFLHNKERRIGPRSWRGRPGWYVVTPLRLHRGRIVLVNRGWVPENRKDPRTRKLGQVSGRVTIAGIVGRPSKPGWFTPDNAPAKEQWLRVDPAALAKHLGLSGVALYWVIAGPAPNPGGLPVGGQGIASPPNNHLQYALTWYALALVLVVIAAVYWRQSRQSL